MSVQEIDIRRAIAAEAGAIYRLLDDSSSWPSWTPIESFELIEPPGADGIGEVRAFRTGRVHVRERIVERKPDRRLSYALLGGLAVRNYCAEIDLVPAADGTSIRWHTTFEPKIPGTGWIYRRALAKATREFVDGLARRAESRV